MRRSVLAFTLLLSACASGYLYPVQGPLMQKSPDLAISIKLVNPRELATTLPDGETYTGQVARIDPADVAANKSAPQWDAVYGPGFFTANVLGSWFRYKAHLAGSRGGALDVEYLRPENLGKGIGIDGAGNVYKLTI